MLEIAHVVVDKVIDARGSYCPKPLPELIRGLKSPSVGGVLELLSSDPGTETDIPTWVRHAGHDFLGAYPAGGYTRYLVRKTHR